MLYYLTDSASLDKPYFDVCTCDISRRLVDCLKRPVFLPHETPGAGGYGSPKDRMPEAVAQDHKSKKFSDSFIEQHFGQVTREV